MDGRATFTIVVSRTIIRSPRQSTYSASQRVRAVRCGISFLSSDSSRSTAAAAGTHRSLPPMNSGPPGSPSNQMAAFRPLVCDLSSLTRPDLGTVADLARLHAAARRLGLDVVLRNASDGVIELVTFVGLADVLRVEPGRQPEEREQRGGVEKERELGDPPG